MRIGDFDLGLKHVLIVAFALIVIIGIFSFMGGSGNSTVYGVNFHIPDGYDEVEQQEVKNGVGESYKYSNNEYHEVIFIDVKDTTADNISQIKVNYPGVKQKTVIDGKEGILVMTSSTGVRNNFYYVEDGKLIHINAPFTDVQNGLHNEDVIAEIIQ